MAQSRYLFALSCFQMDLLNEAESALCPVNEPGAEIPNGAAGHYLLGLIYNDLLGILIEGRMLLNNLNSP